MLINHIMEEYITTETLVSALKESGINQGDAVMFHVDLSILGNVDGDLKDYLNTYYNAMEEALGTDGTIVVPGYFYEFGRKNIPYDCYKSPISRELGIFPRFVFEKPDAKRSINPISALVAVGKDAEYICNGQTGAAYGLDSPFDQLTKLDGKLCFVGKDTSAMTYAHYVEHLVGVPHVYNKLYETPVYKNGERVKYPITAQVRYLNLTTAYDSTGNVPKFEEANIVTRAKVGNGYISTMTCRDTFDFLKVKIQENTSYLLDGDPGFIKGVLPLI